MKKEKKSLYTALLTTFGVGVCCFTPVLVGLFAIVGLSALVPYLDFVLLPALALAILWTVYAYYQYYKNKKTMKNNNTCTSCDNTQEEKSASTKEVTTTTITCPKCGHKQEESIPQTNCQPFYTCNGCDEMISVPKESQNCCVFCEYADKKCPVPNKK